MAMAPSGKAAPAGAAQPPLSNWGSLFLLLFPINLMLSLDKHAIGIASPLIAREMGLSLVQMSLVISAASWSHALLQIPSGWFVERLGFRRTLQLATFLWAGLTIVNASATGFVMLLLVRVALGVGQAPDWAASIVAVRRWFDTSRRSAATSTLLSSLYMGLLVGGPAATWLIARGSWRSCLVTYGLIGIGLAVLWMVLAPRDADSTEARRMSVTSWASMRGILIQPQTWLLGLSYYFLTGLLSFYSTMLPSYLVSARRLDLLSIGSLLSLPYIGLYLAVLVSGKLADTLIGRRVPLKLVRLSMAIGGMTLAALGLIAMIAAPSQFAMGIAIGLSLAGCGFAQVTTWAAIQDMSDRQTGLLSGWVGFWGNLSVGTTPILIALIQHHSGSWTNALLLPAALGLAGALSWTLIKPDRPIKEY